MSQSRIFLVRHGNTFDPPERPYWVGGGTDLGLSNSGKEQAAKVARYLAGLHLPNWKIVFGPSKKQVEFAEHIRRRMPLGVVSALDNRLTDVNLGIWEGKTSAQIKAMGGQLDLARWHSDGLWPLSAQWKPDEEVVTNHLNDLITEAFEVPGLCSLMIVTNVQANVVFKRCADPTTHWIKLNTGDMAELTRRNNIIKIINWNCLTDR